MPAKFYEIPSMGLQDIKQNVTDGRTDGRTDAHTDARTDARTDGQRENSIPPLKLRFGGGYNDYLISEHSEYIVFRYVRRNLGQS